MLTFSVTVSDTSETFLEATSVNFQPTSFTFETPNEKADQLCKKYRKIKFKSVFAY